MDSEHKRTLELLTIFHYVVSGLLALFGCIPFIHVAIGLLFVFGKFEGQSGEPPPPAFGWIFVGIGSFAILTSFAIATAIFFAGRNLKRHRNRMFCLIVAGLECMFMPLGTVLGVFTIITLTKPEVKACFDGEASD